MPNIITLFEAFMEGEPQRVTPLSYDEAVSRIQEFCPDLNPNNQKLYPAVYRGSRNQKAEAFVMRTDIKARHSAYAVNDAYNLFMGANKKYDDRLLSVIGTMDFEYADGYAGYDGNTGTSFNYVLIPRKGATVNVCPASDVFFSFTNLVKKFDETDIGELANILHQLADSLGVVDRALTTLPMWKEFLDRVDEEYKAKDIDAAWPKQEYEHHRMRLLLQAVKASGKGFYNFLLHELDPDNNGFMQFKYGEEPCPNKYGEVWTRGEVLAIRQDKYAQYMRDNFPIDNVPVQAQ